MLRVSIDKITVPEQRQRKEFDDAALEELAESLLTTGQINPIVLDKDRVLIAGERRLRAARLLAERGERIPGSLLGEATPDAAFYIFANEVNPESPLHRHAIELEENIKRDDLTPAERAAAVRDFHVLQQDIHGQAKPGIVGGHTQHSTATQLNMSTGSVSDALRTAKIVEQAPELRHEESQSAILAKFKAKRLKEFKDEMARRAKQTQTRSYEVSTGDGVSYLQSLPAESVHAVISDLPYGIDVDKSTYFDETPWDDSHDTTKHYVKNLLTEVKRVLHANSHVVLFCAWQQTHYIAECAAYVGLSCEYPPYIWDKVSASPSRAASLTADQRHEYIMHLRKGSPEYPERIGHNVLQFAKTRQPVYPTEKPLDLMRYLVKTFSRESHVVCDPNCGSGSTLVAAAQLGRTAIGNDLNPDAVKLTLDRLSLEVDA